MKVSRSQLIVDTNVLIDLHYGGIIELFFALPYEFVSPDVIIAELKVIDGSKLEAFGLVSAELSGEDVLEVEFLWEHNQNIAANDIFALVLASHTGLPLLTGDHRLRVLANKHRVPVHGTLWALDKMVEHNVLTKGQAAYALRLMLENNGRLPTTECAQRFRKWDAK